MSEHLILNPITGKNKDILILSDDKQIFKDPVTGKDRGVVSAGTPIRHTDVSSTTAMAGDVLSGKLFFNAEGEQTEGVIPSKTAETINPSTTDQVIPSGLYLSGNQVIKGDANLVAENIVSGKTIFGIAGSASGGGGTYYKCSSVDSTNHTWSGYKASVDSTTGVWSFSSTLTTGLSYDRLIPAVGKVYDEDCTMQITMYKTNDDGLVFHHSLRSATPFDDLGTTAMTYNNVTFTEIDGRYCMYRNGDQWAEGIPNSQYLFPYGQQPFTMCIWVYETENSGQHGFCGYGTNSSNSCGILAYGADFCLHIVNSSGSTERVTAKFNALEKSSWQHFSYTYNGSDTYIAYLNGQVVQTWTRNKVNPVLSGCNFLIGKVPNYYMQYADYLSDVRLYNRVLSQAEIQEIVVV